MWGQCFEIFYGCKKLTRRYKVNETVFTVVKISASVCKTQIAIVYNVEFPSEKRAEKKTFLATAVSRNGDASSEA